jgi:hypothetical protein
VVATYVACGAAKWAWLREFDTMRQQLSLKYVLSAVTQSGKPGQGPRLIGLSWQENTIPPLPPGFAFVEGSDTVIVPSHEMPLDLSIDADELMRRVGEKEAERGRAYREQTSLQEARQELEIDTECEWDSAGTIAEAAFARLEVLPDMPLALSWTGMPVEVVEGERRTRPIAVHSEATIWVGWPEVDPAEAIDVDEEMRTQNWAGSPIRYGPDINSAVWDRVPLSEYQRLVEAGCDPFDGQ